MGGIVWYVRELDVCFVYVVLFFGLDLEFEIQFVILYLSVVGLVIVFKQDGMDGFI